MKKERNNSKNFNIILGIPGGIAAYKCCELIRLFVKNGHRVKVILSKHGKKFITPLTLETLSGNQVYTDLFSKNSFSTEHISFSKWGDILVVAPATANMIGKFANGIADEILSTIYISFGKPVFIAPAMHTEMWNHPAVQENILKLKKIGVYFIHPESGELASGDVGEGRLADVKTIYDFVFLTLLKKKDLLGKRILITAGPTVEHIDPVRFISSPSSGKMGVCLAREAFERGGKVILVHGPIKTKIDFPVKTLSVQSADEMNRAVLQNKECDIFISSAAVSDYRSKSQFKDKIKKNESDLTIELTRNPDIIENFSKMYGKNKVVVGFAAETSNILKHAKEKLHSKKLDLIVANDVLEKDSGFNSDTNKVTMIFKNGRFEKLPLLPKSEVAKIIFDRITAMKKL